METENAPDEESAYLNYAEVHTINHPLFDHTDDGATHNAVRLMGGNSTEKYGLARSLSVMPGDTIRAEVYAKYLDHTTDNWTAALRNIIIALSGSANPGGTYVDGAAQGTIDGSFPYPDVLVRENDNGTGPKAYLNYILFDRNFTFLTGGFRRVTTDAREAGQGADPVNGVPHEHLYFDDIVIREPGYVYIYLSNENETPVEVFFDDLKVEHMKSPIVQQDDYYPFGLTFNSYQRENSVPISWKFQGQEHIDDLGLNWDSFKWRNHQPEIGRFFNVDPLSEKYFHNSPYAFSENRVIDGNEIEGLEWESIHTKNKDGSTTVTYNVTMKVKNSATLSEGQVYLVATEISGQVESSFQGYDKETNTHYKTEVKLDFESEIDPKRDFYLDLVTEVENADGSKAGSWVAGRVDKVGDTKSNRIQVRVSSDDTVSEITRTGAHETGHTGGLNHPKPGENVDKNNLPVDENNLMRQSTQTTGTNINTDQLKFIDRTIGSK